MKVFQKILRIIVFLYICDPLAGKNEVLKLEYLLNHKVAAGALEDGFSGIAISLYKDIIDDKLIDQITDTEKEEVQLGLITALIAEGDFEQARKLSNKLKFGDGNHPRLLLRKALLAFVGNDQESLQIHTNKLQKHIPHSSEIAWHKFILSIIQPPGANRKKLFFEALKCANTEEQIAELKLLKIRYQLKNADSNEILLANIKTQIEQFRETETGKEFIIQYIIALNSMGKIPEALNEIQKNINHVQESKSNWRDRLLLLYGLIAIEHKDKRISAIASLLREGRDLHYMYMGLKVLSSIALNDRIALNLIDSLIDDKNSIMMPHLLNARIRISLIKGNNEQAEILAKRLIENYTETKLTKAAFWSLASSAWRKNPQNYRLVSDYLLKIKMLTKNQNQELMLSLAIADCYFLNHNYQNALSNYQGVIRLLDNNILLKKCYHQIVNSYINMNKTSQAVAFVSNHVLDESVHYIKHEAYWNILVKMIQNNEHHNARNKIQVILDDKLLKFEQKLKYSWLESTINFTSRNYELCIHQLSDLIQTIIDSNKTFLHNNENLLALALLDNGRAHLENNQTDLAFEMFNRMQNLPFSNVLLQKRELIKANYFGRNNRLDKALEILINIADSKPMNNYAAIALYEAAVYLEQLGQNQHLIQCIIILQRLITEYPNHQLVFVANLKQIKIYKKLGEFATALELCNTILSSNQHQHHNLIYSLLLIKNDCLHAVAQNNPIKLQDVYENFSELRSQHLTINKLNFEIIYKQSIILKKLGKTKEMKDFIYKEIIHNYINKKIYNNLDSESRYWISRSLFELSSLFHLSGEAYKANNIYRKIILLQLPGYKIAERQLKL